MAQIIWKATQPSCVPSIKANYAAFFMVNWRINMSKTPLTETKNESIQINKQVVKRTF